MATLTSSSSMLLQDILTNLHSRKLIIASSPSSLNNDPPKPSPTGANNFDANVVMMLSVLLCALICSLGINSIIRCVLRSSRQVSDSDLQSNVTAATILANTGIRKKALKTFPTMNYTPDLKLPGLDTECAICLSSFALGERVRVLPKCNHGFHVRCIDKWLNSHSSCPTCRHCLIETCQKIVSCSSTTQATISAPVQQETIVISIAPLEPEGLIRTY